MRLLLLLLTSFLFLAAACTKADDDTPTTPLDELPPATQVGANTFGCLIDGVPFVNQGGGFSVQNINANYSPNPDRYFIKAYELSGDGGRDAVKVALRIYRDTVGSFEPMENWEVLKFDTQLQFASYVLDRQNPGLINITSIDRSSQIISGTFNLNIVDTTSNDTKSLTEGRFDVIYFR